MELVIGTLAALGGTAATATGAAAAGITTAGTAAAAGSTLFSAANILQGATTALGAISAIGAANAQANDQIVQSKLIAAEAAQDRLVATTEAARLKRSLADTISGQTVALLSSGASLEGSGRRMLARTARDGAREADNLLAGAQSRQLGYGIERRAARGRAAATRAQGWLTAAGKTTSFLGDLYDRS